MGYYDTVWSGLQKMPLQGQIIIEKSVMPENRTRFIDAVKMFIDCDNGADFYLQFSNDYSRVQKLRK